MIALPLAILFTEQAAPSAPPPGLQCEVRSATGDLMRFVVGSKPDADKSEILIRPITTGNWPKVPATGTETAASEGTRQFLVSGFSAEPVLITLQGYNDRLDVLITQPSGGRTGVPMAVGFCLHQLPPSSEKIAGASALPFDTSGWVPGICYSTTLASEDPKPRFAFKFRSAGNGKVSARLEGLDKTVWATPIDVDLSPEGSGTVRSGKIVIDPFRFFAADGSQVPSGEMATFVDTDTLKSTTTFSFDNFGREGHRGYGICATQIKTTPAG